MDRCVNSREVGNSGIITLPVFFGVDMEWGGCRGVGFSRVNGQTSVYPHVFSGNNWKNAELVELLNEGKEPVGAFLERAQGVCLSLVTESGICRGRLRNWILQESHKQKGIRNGKSVQYKNVDITAT